MLALYMYRLLQQLLASYPFIGVTDAAIMPLLALLVDRRHVAAYGSVYAIVQLSVCLAYGLGNYHLLLKSDAQCEKKGSCCAI